MSFKAKGFLLIGLVFLSLMIAACSLDMGEEPFVAKIPKINSDISCIDNVGLKFEKYFEGELDANGVIEFFNCAKNAMKTFKDRTDGRDSGSYTPEELRQYLYKFFIKNNTISDKLLVEAMKVKQTMVGGSLYKLTKDELIRGIELLDIIKSKALMALPYLDIYTFKRANPASTAGITKRINKALEILQNIAGDFGKELLKNKQSYSFESFKEFTREFRRFLNWDKHDYTSEKFHSLDNWIELAKSFKNLAFSSNAMKVQASEWPPFLSQSMGWFGIVLRFKYTVRNWDLLIGKGLSNLNLFVEESLLLLKKLLIHRENPYVEFHNINVFAYALERLELMPFDIQASTIESIIPEYIKRGFIDIDKPLKERVAKGLNLEAINNIEYEYNLWASVQNILIENRNKEGNVEFPAKNLLVDVNACANKRVPTRYVTAECELARLIAERPMFKEGYSTAYLIQGSLMGDGYNFVNLSMLNVVRIAVRTLILTFGNYDTEADRNRTFSQKGVTEEELEKFYVTSKLLGVDLKFMDPMGKNVGRRSFKEGKLFTYAGRGIGKNNPGSLINYSELTQLASLLYSGGNIGTTAFDQMLAEVCPDSGVSDVFGEPTMYYTCFQREFGGYFKQQFQTLPGMSEYLGQMSIIEYDQFIKFFYLNSFGKRFDNVHVEYSDFTFMFTIMHYIEATMTHFDSEPMDGVITFSEADKAFQRFRTLFESLAPSTQKAQDYLVGQFVGMTLQTNKIVNQASTAIDNTLKDFTEFFNELFNTQFGVVSTKEFDASTMNFQLESTEPLVQKDIEVSDQKLLDLSEERKLIEENKEIIQSKGFEDEMIKVGFFLALINGEMPGATRVLYETIRKKMGLGYSSKIKNLKVDRRKLVRVFMMIVNFLTKNGSDEENPPTNEWPYEPPVERDFRNEGAKK